MLVLSFPAKVRARFQVNPVGLLADRTFLEYLGFPLSVSFHEHSTLKCSHHYYPTNIEAEVTIILPFFLLYS